MDEILTQTSSIEILTNGISGAYLNPAYPELDTLKKALDYILGNSEYVLTEIEDPNVLEDIMYLQD